MSVRKTLKTDTTIESQTGVWLEYGTNDDNGKEQRILVLRSGGANTAYEQGLVAAFRPYRAQIKAEVLSPDIGKKLIREVFARTCVKDWQGFTDPAGKDYGTFSTDDVIAYFTEVPDFYHDVAEQAGKAVMYRTELQKAAAGN